MAAQSGRTGVGCLVLVIVVLVLSLGFHWIHVKLSSGHKFCVETKDQLGFKDTFITANGPIDLAIHHPLLATGIAAETRVVFGLLRNSGTDGTDGTDFSGSISAPICPVRHLEGCPTGPV